MTAQGPEQVFQETESRKHQSLKAQAWKPAQHHFARIHAKSLQLYLTSYDPMDCSPPGSSDHGILQVRILEWVAMPSSRGSSQPRDQTQVSSIARDSLPAEPPWKSKNTEVGTLSLLQRIFPTQESTQGLLHCRRILYHLSNQGSVGTSVKSPASILFICQTKSSPNKI